MFSSLSPRELIRRVHRSPSLYEAVESYVSRKAWWGANEPNNWAVYSAKKFFVLNSAIACLLFLANSYRSFELLYWNKDLIGESSSRIRSLVACFHASCSSDSKSQWGFKVAVQAASQAYCSVGGCCTDRLPTTLGQHYHTLSCEKECDLCDRREYLN